MPNNASEPVKVSSMTKIKIVEQIEYYFGDFNMMRDKFLREEVSKDPEGWINLKTLLSFNRLKSLTEDPEVILDAFMENSSEIVEIDNEGHRIRRKPGRPIPEANETWRNSLMQRSVYIKGFPPETTTLNDVIQFVSTFGKVENVFMRKYRDKALNAWKFKGSVFVAFPTREDAEKVVEIKSLKFGGNELIVLWQKDYIEKKKAERMQVKQKAKEEKAQQLKEEIKAKNGTVEKLPTGALIKLTGLHGKIDTYKLKEKLIEDYAWNVAFIQHENESSDAYVRLQTKDSAKEAIGKTDCVINYDNLTISATVLEGDEEEKILTKMESDKNTIWIQKKNKGGRKHKGGFKKGGKQHRNDNSKPTSNKNEMEVDGDNAKSKNGNSETSDDSHQEKNVDNQPKSMIDEEKSSSKRKIVDDENVAKKAKSDN